MPERINRIVRFLFKKMPRVQAVWFYWGTNIAWTNEAFTTVLEQVSLNRNGHSNLPVML